MMIPIILLVLIEFNFDIGLRCQSYEITTIYSFYRFKPLHRTLSTRHETFSIDTWENLKSQAFLQIMRQIFFMQYLFIFLNSISSFIVTRDSNYFWLSLLLFSLVISAIYLVWIYAWFSK